jgi:hypothetical protein
MGWVACWRLDRRFVATWGKARLTESWYRIPDSNRVFAREVSQTTGDYGSAQRFDGVPLVLCRASSTRGSSTRSRCRVPTGCAS